MFVNTLECLLDLLGYGVILEAVISKLFPPLILWGAVMFAFFTTILYQLMRD
jgi:hypothetical protein